MTVNNTILKRIISVLLCAAMLLSYLPSAALKTAAADKVTGSASIIADAGTAHTWESMMGTTADGNRYAGRVWADKSVYTNGQTALLNSSGAPGSTFKVNLEEDEAFQIIFSALGSSMTTTSTNSYVGPMDVVLVLDGSVSMADNNRLRNTLSAANTLLADLLEIPNIRIGLVTYSETSEIILPLDYYTNGVTLSANSYSSSSSSGVISARDNDGNLLGRNSGYGYATFLQAGLDECMQMLANAENVTGRVPVAIVLTDGEANEAVQSAWYNVSGTSSSISTYPNTSAGVFLSTMLTAAYGKACVERTYGRAPMVYGIGTDLNSSSVAHAMMNPASGFHNGNNANSVAKEAYNAFVKWQNGETVTLGNGTQRFSLGQLPSSAVVSRDDVIKHINYVDTYYDVSSSKLEVTFTQIYEELTSGVFNPISSTQTVTGGTGVKNTPLVFVDNIGQHMEIKRIQSITLFGASYQVTHNADGTYTVVEATGVNPTTNESYNTAEDIRISVVRNEDGTQTLRIEIDQEILPIILEQVKSETVGGMTSAVINEMTYNPLRVYYTVGLAADIFLPTGEIDVSKIDDDYAYIDDATGQITFYSNQFGSVELTDENGDPYVQRLDSHIGFKPSDANRYYYHQSNVDIYTSVTPKDSNTTINWDASEYGVLEQDDTYNFVHMTYADYLAIGENNPTVYSKVTYHRPTTDATDAANAAEEVTYIVYTEWQYMKESVAFFDSNAGVYINYAASGYTTGSKGYAMEEGQITATISAYLADHPGAEIRAVVGVGSLRTSRLHNMMVAKENNATGTEALRYAPEYTYETAANHSDNDVVIWLGNNGKLTTTIATGIALTKSVTETFGNADDTYALTVTVPSGVSATPVVKNANGEDVTAAISTYAGNVLTVNLKAGETVYISGIPAETVCAIGEVIQGDYYIDSKTDTVTIPALSQVLAGTAQYVPANVTNAPNKYGNLFITKEMTSAHPIPASVLAQDFALKVHVGAALAGKTFTVKLGNLDNPGTETTTSATVDAAGDLHLTIHARQTLEILGLPEGTQATVTEELTAAQQTVFATAYRTRNHTGESADTDNTVIIPANANATAVITNHYTPLATTVDLDIAGTKNFFAEDNADLAGGSFTFKVQHWNGSAWVDMASVQTAYAAGEEGVKTFLIEDVLQGITYAEAGTWTYQVLEVKGSLDNVTYDRTLYTFTVTVTDNGGQLVAVVTDMNNTEITDGSYEVTFTNTYHTAPVSIDVTKELVNNSGDDTISKAGFAFNAVQTDASWNPLADGATLTVYSDGAGDARFTATYTQAGTYYYLVSEVAGTAPGWTYSKAQYRVTITVTESDGNLISTMTIEAVAGTAATGEQASVNGNSGTISFVNTYDPEDVAVDLNNAVLKELTGKTLTAGAFTFKVYENGTTNVVLTGSNDAYGKVTFDSSLSFAKAGKYEYDVVEVIPEGAVYDNATGKYILHGMHYDATIYDLVVEVTNNSATGKLEAVYYFEDATINTVTFRNVYTVTATTYTFQGTKILHGRALGSGEFTFWLYQGDTPVEHVTNKADGSFSFSTITYTSAGTYVYTIREEAGSTAGITYTGASNPITVTVTVTDTNGVLSAVADVANADIVFENSYTAKAATVTFDGTKNLVGALLADKTFTFHLYQTDSNFDLSSAALVETVENFSGRYQFTTLTFPQTGTFFYAIVEDASVNPQTGIVYDETVHQFRVQVTDVGDGQLRVEVQNLNSGTTTPAAAAVTVSTSFTNATFDEVTEKEVYLAGSTETHIDGQKVNAGDILEYYITYTNYTGKDVTVDIMDTIPAHTVFVEGSASHGGSYVGTHVLWVLNVAKGQSVTVSFQVKVTETDAIVSNTAMVRDGVNSYSTNEVNNHTYEQITNKDVFAAGDPTVSINGQMVELGDKLLYTIRFTNTTGANVSVTITDLIPANTAYVAGSATLGGVYADGQLTWSLTDVAAWSTVTVSFQVEVTATEHTTIQNQANIAVGENNYSTNIVSNGYVPETTGFTVNKIWDDANNQDGKRPDSITVHIYANGRLTTSVQLTAAGEWTYTLTDLDKYENGAEIVYTVQEAAITGYTYTVSGSQAVGFTITNTHEVEKTHISASKVWDDQDDQDGKRPDSITVHLLANGEHTGMKMVLSADNDWSHTWTDLDVYHNGTQIVYTVYEEPVDGYTANYDRDSSDNTHVIITNTYAPEKTGLTVQKVWHDNDNQDGIRPEYVEVELYANNEATGLKVTLSAANNWRYSFTDLDKFADGVIITYTVVELTKAEGYEVSYQLDADTGVYEVINTHEPAKTQVSVNKVWNDANDQDGLRPGSVEVELYADGIATGKKLTLSSANGWKGTFTDVDAYSNGTAVVYTVREVAVPAGYTMAISGTVADGFTITNTHEVAKTSITVNKIWNDQENQDGKRPVVITVNLYANGTKIATQVLDATMNWSYTWTNLDKNANGEAIVYTVDEVAVDGYTTSIDGLVITNSHAVEKTTMSVSKVWDDHDDQDGKRPASITVHLLADGEHTGLKVVLSESNGWTHTWPALDKYSGGKLINYTVYEEEVDGYTADYARDSADDNHVIITNVYTPEKTTVHVQKLWSDNHNQDGIRPGSVQVELYANGVATGKKLTLKEATHWKGAFADLDKYADGVEIRYSIKETAVEGYTSEVGIDELTGVFTVTNTHVPETVDITVNKIWVDNDDQDGIRPNSVVLELYADGIATGKTLTVTAASGWKATFQGLAKYSYGTEVIYTVREVNVPTGYTASYNGTTVTNTHIPETLSITVNKVWVDSNNQDNLRPESITVNLYASGVLYSSLEMNRENLGIVTFTDLPKYDKGVEIVYTVKEANVPTGYTDSYSGSAAEGFTITNTHQVYKTQITATKVWNDANNQDGKRPANITLHLLANGAHTGKKVVVSAASGWSYTWTDLDVYHNGTKIVYTVYEEPVDGYLASYQRDASNPNRVIITNTYTPEKTALTVQKVWNDNDNQDGIRPGSIQVELYADGVATGIKVTLSAANNWRHTFKDLDKYAAGRKIVYTVVELTQTAGYEASYKLDAETGLYEIINTHQPLKTDIQVNKAWNDANNQDGIRPGSIEVELYANGVPTGKKLTLNALNGWKGTFANLNVYTNGAAVVYTVQEVNVPNGYSVAITGSAAEGFTLTNTHAVAKTDITVNKIWADKNDQDGKRPGSITVNLYANGVKIDTQTLNASVNWTYTWANLDKYAGGKLIVYTVDEVAVDGYVTSINGFTITNSRDVEKTELSVTKFWNDANDQDGKRPASITVHLLADGEHTGITKVLSAANGWSATWDNLDKYADGDLINYTVYEAPVDGYYTTYARDSADDSHVIITNHYNPEKTAFAVLKVWHDDHNRDGLRTDVTVEVYANGVATGITATLSAANHWTYTFADLDKYADGKAIVYSAVELTQLAGYTTTYRTDEYTGILEIINTHTPITTQISVNKVWDDANDQDGIRPGSIDVLLFANGIDTGMKLTLSASNQWKAVFTDLPAYAHGAPVVYTVQEQAGNGLSGYTAAITYVDSNTIVITNTHTPAVKDIPVEKVWEDHNNQDGKRPTSITLALLANGKDTGIRMALTEKNDWRAVFTNLPVYSNGDPIVYTFEELNVPDGYSVRYEGNTVINTYQPETVTIQVNKLWSDNDDQDGIRPDFVEVFLYANGVNTGRKLILTAENGWTGAWTDLPKYEKGTLIHYTVEETAVEGYVADYSWEGDEVTVTNLHVPETVIVSASKLWDDDNDRDGFRPDKVLFVLTANGVATDKILELNQENNWYGEWTNLPKYENGALIVYGVMEIDLAAGYVSIVDPNGDNAYAFTVTNSHAPLKTTLTASKLWQDDDNAQNTRPESIVIALLANGEIVEEVVLNESNGWKHTWNDLYLYANGQQIVYTVVEVTADENYIVSYTSSVGEKGELVWQITNTLIESSPDTGDHIRPVIMMMLLSMVCVVALIPTVRKKEQ